MACSLSLSLSIGNCLSLRQEKRLVPLLSKTALPRTWRAFQAAEEHDRRAATALVARTKYVNVLDYLVGLLDPKQRDALEAFYAGRGDSLLHQVTPSRLRRIDRMMATRVRELMDFAAKVRRLSTPGARPGWVVFVLACHAMGVDDRWNREVSGRPVAANDDPSQPAVDRSGACAGAP